MKKLFIVGLLLLIFVQVSAQEEPMQECNFDETKVTEIVGVEAIPTIAIFASISPGTCLTVLQDEVTGIHYTFNASNSFLVIRESSNEDIDLLPPWTFKPYLEGIRAPYDAWPITEEGGNVFIIQSDDPNNAVTTMCALTAGTLSDWCNHPDPPLVNQLFTGDFGYILFASCQITSPEGKLKCD